MSRYKCHTDNNGPAPRRSEYRACDWTGDVVVIKTDWMDISCGHVTSESDPECTGCRYRGGDWTKD